MGDDRERAEMQVYGPNDALPVHVPHARLPHPEAVLPPGFPATGFFRLLRLGSAMRISSRYAAALDALEALYRSAAGVHDAQLELSRAIGRLRDKQTILAADQAAREHERILAETRKFRAGLDRYRARAALEEYKNRDAQGSATPGNTFADEVENILRRAFEGDNAA